MAKPEKTLAMRDFDHQMSRGLWSVGGVDEAGRGPLAGPVVAACVMLPFDNPILGINDSKKLTPKKRDTLYQQITDQALFVATGMVDADRIDDINILEATKEAIGIAASDCPAELLIIDFVHGLDLRRKTHLLVNGDALSYHVAAASIVAKVTRDRLMVALATQYLAYGFDKHKGYGTAAHVAALHEHGPCPIHRRSFLGKIMARDTQKL